MNKKLIVLIALILFGASFAAAAVTYRFVNKPTGYSEYYNFFDASGGSTTTTAVSTNNDRGEGNYVVAGAKKVTMYFSRSWFGGNAGLSKFEVEGTPDGTNWYTIERLLGDDVSATATSSVTITAATTTERASIDLTNQAFYAIRCKVTEVTDGRHSCTAYAEF